MTTITSKPTFTVTRCAVMRYSDTDDKGLYPFAPEQNEERLAIALQMPWDRPDEFKEQLVMAWWVEREGVETSVIVDLVEKGSLWGDDPAGNEPCNADFEGVEWQMCVSGLASTAGLPLYEGICEQRTRAIAAELQSLVDVRNAIREYNAKLDAAENAPDGNDYNALLDLAGI